MKRAHGQCHRQNVINQPRFEVQTQLIFYLLHGLFRAADMISLGFFQDNVSDGVDASHVVERGHGRAVVGVSKIEGTSWYLIISCEIFHL
jgi:hypothetical protein